MSTTDQPGLAGQPLEPWLRQLFAAIDSQNAAAFAEYFTDEGRFVYANSPPVVGRAAIRDYVAGFFRMLASIRHGLLGAWAVPGHVFVELTVTYVLKDGQTFTFPAFDLLKLEGGRIRDYLIYVDASPMLAAARSES